MVSMPQPLILAATDLSSRSAHVPGRAAALAGILLLLSTWFTGELVANQMRSGTTSYGLQLPAWWYTIGLPLAFLLVFVRFVQHAAGEHRALAAENDTDA